MAGIIVSHRLKIIYIISTILFIYFVGCADSPYKPGTVSVEDVLRILPRHHDIGDIPNLSSDLVVDIPTTLRNEGSHPITIKQITSDCSCSALALSEDTIAPGAEVTLITSIRVGSSAEVRRSTISIVSSLGEDTHTQGIEFSWRSINPLKTEPEVCTFEGTLNSFGEATQELDIFGRGLVLCDRCNLKLFPSSPLVTAWFQEDGLNRVRRHDPEPKNTAQTVRPGTIVVFVEGGTEARVHRERIDLLVDCDGRSLGQLNLPVNWTTEPDIEVSPSTIALGIQSPGNTMSKTLQIKSTDGEEFEVVRVGLEGTDAEFRPSYRLGPASVHVVKIEFKLPRDPGPWRDHICIETNLKGSLAFELPISSIILEDGDGADNEEGIHSH